jgi:hypothetical protein
LLIVERKSVVERAAGSKDDGKRTIEKLLGTEYSLVLSIDVVLIPSGGRKNGTHRVESTRVRRIIDEYSKYWITRGRERSVESEGKDMEAKRMEDIRRFEPDSSFALLDISKKIEEPNYNHYSNRNRTERNGI